MAEITAEMVRTLREETGAGMMDCKKALTDAGGDIGEAKLILRKKGQASLDKRAERTASEGIIEVFTSEPGDVGVMVELNCETDFVARGEAFRSLAAQIARIIANAPLQGGYAGLDALLSAPIESDSKQSVRELVTESAGRIGEKVEISRFVRYDVGAETQAVGSYIHRTDFKTGVLVEVASDKTPTDGDALGGLAREVALHVAAAKPLYVNRDQVPSELIEREREIAMAKMNADPKFAGKPEQAKTQMVEGQVRKYLEQSVLTDQAFVRDPSGKQRVSSLVADASKQAGAGVQIVRFDRFRVGETQSQTDHSEGDTTANA